MEEESSSLNRYYVYVYLNPLKSGDYNYEDIHFDYQPFYVGKGEGNRMNYHKCNYGLNKCNNKHKVNTIRKILNEGYEPIILKVFNNLTEEEAFFFESELIDMIGRSDLKRGSLTNLTNGGEGMSGYIMSEEQKENIRLKATGRKHSEEFRKMISDRNKELFKDPDIKKIFVSYLTDWYNGLSEEERIERHNKIRGENNPNFGNKWNDEQRKNASDYQKKFSNFVKNNPQKINPRRGLDNGATEYCYLVYDLTGNLIFKSFGVKEIVERFKGFSYNCVRKYSKVNKCYKGYYLSRVHKDDFNNIIEQIIDENILIYINNHSKIRRTKEIIIGDIK